MKQKPGLLDEPACIIHLLGTLILHVYEYFTDSHYKIYPKINGNNIFILLPTGTDQRGEKNFFSTVLHSYARDT